MSEKCPVCGEPVKVVGDETKHYESIAAQTIKELQAQVERLREAMEFSCTPDMWVEQHDGMLDYRYVEWYQNVLQKALDETPTQSLSAIRNEAIEECLEYLLGLFWGRGTINKKSDGLFILVNDWNEGESFDSVAKAIRNLPYPQIIEEG